MLAVVEAWSAGPAGIDLRPARSPGAWAHIPLPRGVLVGATAPLMAALLGVDEPSLAARVLGGPRPLDPHTRDAVPGRDEVASALANARGPRVDAWRARGFAPEDLLVSTIPVPPAALLGGLASERLQQIAGYAKLVDHLHACDASPAEVAFAVTGLQAAVACHLAFDIRGERVLRGAGRAWRADDLYAWEEPPRPPPPAPVGAVLDLEHEGRAAGFSARGEPIVRRGAIGYRVTATGLVEAPGAACGPDVPAGFTVDRHAGVVWLSPGGAVDPLPIFGVAGGGGVAVSADGAWVWLDDEEGGGGVWARETGARIAPVSAVRPDPEYICPQPLAISTRPDGFVHFAGRELWVGGLLRWTRDVEPGAAALDRSGETLLLVDEEGVELRAVGSPETVLARWAFDTV